MSRILHINIDARKVILGISRDGQPADELATFTATKGGRTLAVFAARDAVSLFCVDSVEIDSDTRDAAYLHKFAAAVTDKEADINV